jgi:hypothetical protein
MTADGYFAHELSAYLIKIEYTILRFKYILSSYLFLTTASVV